MRGFGCFFEIYGDMGERRGKWWIYFSSCPLTPCPMDVARKIRISAVNKILKMKENEETKRGYSECEVEVVKKI